MSYVKREWKDRMVENPKTYNIINNSDGTITLEDRPGAVYEEGTPISAENMNHMEEGIEEAYISATRYTDNAIAELVGQAPEAMDTIYELASLMAQNQDMVDLLNQAVAQKAAQAELDTLRNTVNNKHSLIKKQLYPAQIQKYGSDSVLTSLSIPAGSCSGLIYITFQENLSLKEISTIRLSWGTADDYPVLINYCTAHNDNGVSLVMWNLGKSDFTITKSTRLDVIGWS